MRGLSRPRASPKRIDRLTVNVLLTGFSGFSGYHLQQHLRCIPLADGEGRPIDLLDSGALAEAIGVIQPDAVMHLAARTFVPDSFRDPHATFSVNVMGTLNLLTALQACGFSGRMLHVSSAEVYGLVDPRDLPMHEAHPPRPRNPYAASKAAAEALAYQWSQTGSFQILTARPFNLIGPRQQECFVMSNFARQIAEISLGRRPPRVEVGDIDVTRDFTDVRDAVRAYEAILERGTNGEVYNVCSGTERSVRSMLEALLEARGVEAEIVHDTERLRPSEQRRMVGNCDKLKAACGWRPEIPMQQTLSDIVTDWESRLQ